MAPVTGLLALVGVFLSHVFGSLLGSAVIGAVAIGYAVWRWRMPMRDVLISIDWPLRRRSARPGPTA